IEREYQSAFYVFSSRRRHTRFSRDWSSDVCSSDLAARRVVKRARVNMQHAQALVGAMDLVVTVHGPLDAGAITDLEPEQDRNLRSEERRVGKASESRWSAARGTGSG